MYTKQMQTHKNKRPKITTHEKEFLSWLQTQDYKCFACGGSNGIEFHHVKKSSVERKNHLSLIPLCGVSCHRLGKYSAHGNPKWFREMFSMEWQEARAREIYYDFLASKGIA